MLTKHNEKKIIGLAELGKAMLKPDNELVEVIQKASYRNAWFTIENITEALISWGKVLTEELLYQWLEPYYNKYNTENYRTKKVGLILAGNIPLVGLHDILCVLLSHHHALIKLSSQDNILIPYLLDRLKTIEPTYADLYTFTEKLSAFDAIIATGSNNSARYFNYYFNNYPHIIRKNRNSIAVLNGKETDDDLLALGKDLFMHFGLGCRNVSKLAVPEKYDFNHLLKILTPFQKVTSHHKYMNNYDYYKSIYLVNKEPHLDTGFLLLKEDPSLASPLSVIYYEYYKDITSLEEELNTQQEKIQCVVSKSTLNTRSQIVDFGKTQEPALWDYADQIDTMNFLLNL